MMEWVASVHFRQHSKMAAGEVWAAQFRELVRADALDLEEVGGKMWEFVPDTVEGRKVWLDAFMDALLHSLAFHKENLARYLVAMRGVHGAFCTPSLDKLDIKGRSPVAVAMIYGNTAGLRLLFANGASAQAPSKTKKGELKSPIFFATMRARCGAIRVLLQEAGRGPFRWPIQEEVFTEAMVQGERCLGGDTVEPMFRVLLQAEDQARSLSASPHGCDRLGRYFHWAARIGASALVHVINRVGGQSLVDFLDDALRVAFHQGHVCTALLLCKLGAKPERVFMPYGPAGLEPFIFASQRGRGAQALAFFKGLSTDQIEGLDVRQLVQYRYALLWLSTTDGSKEEFTAALDDFLPITTWHPEGRLKLFLVLRRAMYEGASSFFRIGLSRVRDPQAKSLIKPNLTEEPAEMTIPEALAYAALEGKLYDELALVFGTFPVGCFSAKVTDILSCVGISAKHEGLIRLCVQRQVLGERLMRPVWVTIYNTFVKEGSSRDIRLLLLMGFDPNHRSEDGSSPLDTARGFKMRSDHHTASVARVLVAHGADANATCERGLTALFRAANAKFVKTTRVLLQSGANPNGFGRDKIPPLAYFLSLGVCKKREEMTRVYLQSGARPCIMSQSHGCPFIVAKTRSDLVHLARRVIPRSPPTLRCDQEPHECIFCMSAPATVAVLPCGHRYSCPQCWENHLDLDNYATKGLCPLCRAPFEYAVNVRV